MASSKADIVVAVPAILSTKPGTLAFPLEDAEQKFLKTAAGLFDAGYYDHALLDLWNASVHNIRRRVEAYGVDLFLSVVKDEPGKKKYDPAGESFPERWSGVEDAVLITGAARLGLLSKKAGKALEMINWMRNPDLLT